MSALRIRELPCRRPRTFEELLLQLGLGDLDLDRLVHLLLVTALAIRVLLDGGGEERVDEGRLAEARLASNLGGPSVNISTQPYSPTWSSARIAYHDGEGSTALGDDLVPLVRQIGNANR